MEKISHSERTLGIVYGTAVFDAIGKQVEGVKNITTPVTGYGPYQGSYDQLKNLAPNEWTDDTILTIATALGLVRAGFMSIGYQTNELIRAYNRYPDKGMGTSTKLSIQKLEKGVEWDQAAKAGGGTGVGNGVCMKTAIIAAWATRGDSCLDLKTVLDFTEKVGRLTHHDPRGYLPGVYMTWLTYKLMTGCEGSNKLILTHGTYPDRLFRELVEFASNQDNIHYRASSLSDSVHLKLQLAYDLPEQTTIFEAARILGTSCYAPESFSFVIWCFFRHVLNSTNPTQAILDAINCGGDTDSVGAMLGALHGAYAGRAWIPAEFRNKVHRTKHLYSVAIQVSTAP